MVRKDGTELRLEAISSLRPYEHRIPASVTPTVEPALRAYRSRTHERLAAEIEAAEEKLAAAEGDARAALEVEVEKLKAARDGLAVTIEEAHEGQDRQE